jgi:ribosomal protein S18 acetylase RimI-like enzyme
MSIELREIRAADREPLAAMLRRVENFAPDEVEVALELIDASIAEPGKDYACIVATEHERILGYLCWGLTPMTDWTYDLYWVAVDPDARGRRIGKQLTLRFEELVRERGGKIIRIETSSMESYGGTLEFYLRTGYEIASRIRDFYRAGDDLITLTKRFDS